MSTDVRYASISSILLNLIQIEKKGISLGSIDESGLFTCDMCKVPVYWVKLNPEEHRTFDDSRYTFVIPNDGNGDILHSIQIYGKYKHAEIFQHSFLDGRIVYDQIDYSPEDVDPCIMMPFPESGIPLIQIKKNIYIEIIPHDDTPEQIPQVEFGYGFLDVPLRNKLEKIPKHVLKGVSILHKSNKRFAVFGINSLGSSINIIGPEAI